MDIIIYGVDSSVGTSFALLRVETIISKSIAKGLPMKTPFKCMTVCALTCLFLTISFAKSALAETKKPAIKQEQIEKINKQLKDIEKNTQEIKKQSKSTHDLAIINEAEKAGLSKIIKAMSPKGGRFELQADGAIKIIPGDSSIVNKLLNKQNKESSKKVISKDSEEIIKRLQKANKQGLSDLLNRLATDGGDFELVENGGIRIIPNSAIKTKELAKKASSANKLVKQKNLGGLTNKLSGLGSSANSWGKVRNLAKSWIKKNNKKGLSVGKIRNIKWLYLVSIVTGKGNMDTQLVIRVVDGKTVAFTKNTFEVFN